MFNINQRGPLYDPDAVQPMREELTYVGFQELTVPEEVDQILSAKDNKTKFVVINSVCGCAAGSARPGATLALQHRVIPDQYLTIFAGQDRDAVDLLRNKFLSEYPPSSPSMALIKNGEVVFMMPRHHIEGRSHEEIAHILKQVFEIHCSKKGPSISAEEYEKLVHAKTCGSQIPRKTN